VSASFGLGPGADTWNINVDESQGASADIYFFGQCPNGATGVGKLFNALCAKIAETTLKFLIKLEGLENFDVRSWKKSR